MDGTPILDIKPYLPHVDSHAEALGSFTEKTKEYFIPVEIPDELLEKIRRTAGEALKKCWSRTRAHRIRTVKSAFTGFPLREWKSNSR